MPFTPFTFTLTLLIVLGVVQSIGAVGYFWIDRPGMAVMFTGFTIGNCGLIYDLFRP
jgi:hypothetical protein